MMNQDVIVDVKHKVKIGQIKESNDIRRKRIDSLKMAIDKNQLTIDVCDRFMNEMIELKRDEMKEISKKIVDQILVAAGNEQKIRCEQTLAFIDRLTICNDSIWIFYYRELIWWCYPKLKDHVDVAEQMKLWIKAKEKYVEMLNLQFWKETNHPDRLWILSEFAYLCYWYDSSVDSDAIDLVKKLIDEVKMMDQRVLSELEWNKSKRWIEKSEMDLEMCQLWNTVSGIDNKKYCQEQMAKLKKAINTANQLSAKEMRRIWTAFGIQLNSVSSDGEDGGQKSEFCIEMLNRLDGIKFGKQRNWIYCYQGTIYHCYSTLAEIINDADKRREIADRMYSKYQQIIDISNEIFENELNHPIRIDIVSDFSSLSLKHYKNDVSTECIQFLQSITTELKSKLQGSLTDFELELSQRLLQRIEKLIVGTVD